MKALLVLAVAIAVGAGCAPKAHADDFAGLIDIGDGRQLYLNCQGVGSPTVFIVPGKGSYAEVWNVVVPPDDPIRSSPYDIIEQAKLGLSPTSTQPTVAKTTQVCAYDRPDTRPDGTDRSTPVPQPHSVQADVDDLVKLFAAANISTPVVMAAHSYGGLVADLFSRTHSELVSGLVMVEPTSEFLMKVGNPEQNAAFDRDGRIPPEPGGESILADDAFATLQAAPPLPTVPAIVLSGDKFAAPAALRPDNYTQAQIHLANTLLADALGTENVIVAGGGHNLMLYQPQAVSDAIVTIVEKVRAGP